MITFRSSVGEALCALAAGAAICACGLFSARAQEPKTSEKAQIPGGIEGRVKSVDHQKETLSIIASTGKEHTFKVTEDTTMLGPRGGKVRRRLNDKRFHEGMELTVVADGSAAKEIHLGFSRSAPAESAAAKPVMKRGSRGLRERLKAARNEASTKTADPAKAAAAEEEDEDDEIPGKVKSFDPTRRVLVVALLNGKNRSFLLANDVKVVVKGTPSTQGLKDAAIKDGAVISVFVEPGGRKVKEIQITPAPAAAVRRRKAG